MKLFHITHRNNLASIQATGLEPERAVGARKAVWAGTQARVQWGIVHVLSKPRNKGATVEDIVVLELEVSRRTLTRYGRVRGVWFTPCTVPPSSIVAMHEAAEYGKGVE
jgi:hypothetical protein